MQQRSTAKTPNPHLPPHLRDVCDLLARGVVRLRSRAAEQPEPEAGSERVVGLPSVLGQRVHANPRRKGVA